MDNTNEPLYERVKKIKDVAELGVVSSPSTTQEIVLDIRKKSENKRALGQMVFVHLQEDGRQILSLGQIFEVETKNRWHEDQSFKGVIKHYGSLPHLSGKADNRMAKISVQSSFDITNQEPKVYVLGMSPSTGIPVQIVNNSLMNLLVEHHKKAITYLGKVYETEVDLPMWFKHFDRDKDIPALGAQDAYHIGVFGKTGSGKSVTSALMLLAYAKNKQHMNILVLDPQGQFYKDRDLLPGDGGSRLAGEIRETGMRFEKYKLIEDVSLPENVELLGELLANSGFIKEAFGPFYGDDKIERMRDSVIEYIEGRRNDRSFSLNSDPDELLSKMIERFINLEPGEKDFSKYIKAVYGTRHTQQRLFDAIQKARDALERDTPPSFLETWKQVLAMFSEVRRTTIAEICAKITSDTRGNFIVLDLSPSDGEIENENLQALFLRLIEKDIVQSGGNLYAKGKNANCLIIMDEAHRFISRHSPDPRVKELTRQIVDAVRTTRKYGIGHMFITQSLESLDDEIIKQMRIFAFGHGLTMGAESRKMREILNNPAAVSLYSSFIDPSNSGKYPFMFFGPVSPFSATGSPLFVEIYTSYQDYRNKNPLGDR
ncbi:MAG: DUF87 domain-containing protein [Nitrospira sp.]|nr:DUF87 domain-containing protein [Nitrospira sp.]